MALLVDVIRDARYGARLLLTIWRPHSPSGCISHAPSVGQALSAQSAEPRERSDTALKAAQVTAKRAMRHRPLSRRCFVLIEPRRKGVEAERPAKKILKQFGRRFPITYATRRRSSLN